VCLASVNYTLDRFTLISICRKKGSPNLKTSGFLKKKLANSRKLSLRFSYLFFRLFARPEWLILPSQALSRCWKSPADGVVLSSAFAGVVGGAVDIAAKDAVKRPNRSRIESLNVNTDGQKRGGKTTATGKSAAGWD